MQRNQRIDVIRGMAIMLVVLGHSGVSEPLFQWIYSFHMPLFFFVSGIFFKPMAHFFGGGI